MMMKTVFNVGTARLSFLAALSLGWMPGSGSMRPALADGVLLTPTPVGFAKPATLDLFPTPVKKGILSCNSSPIAGQDSCRVRNMPLLLQTDSRLDPDVQDMGPVGCYDTSILTLILTALANRSPSLSTLYGRVATLEAVPADAANAVPKDVKQLSWFYRVVKQSQAQVAAKLPIRTVYPLYFPEVVASFNDGSTLEKASTGCNPNTYGQVNSCSTATNIYGSSYRNYEAGTGALAWTNQAIVNQMRQGYVQLIAYGRYGVRKITVDGAERIFFIRRSQHKVVFSGFQPGSYPLLINDVGNATRYKVRLVNGLSKEQMARVLSAGVDPAKVMIEWPQGRKTVIEYEGDNGGEVFFVDHVDALRLKS